jgi:hypothetical protein
MTWLYEKAIQRVLAILFDGTIKRWEILERLLCFAIADRQVVCTAVNSSNVSRLMAEQLLGRALPVATPMAHGEYCNNGGTLRQIPARQAAILCPRITSGAKSAGLVRECGAQLHSLKVESAGFGFDVHQYKKIKIDISQLFSNWVR